MSKWINTEYLGIIYPISGRFIPTAYAFQHENIVPDYIILNNNMKSVPAFYILSVV